MPPLTALNMLESQGLPRNSMLLLEALKEAVTLEREALETSIPHSPFQAQKLRQQTGSDTSARRTSTECVDASVAVRRLATLQGYEKTHVCVSPRKSHQTCHTKSTSIISSFVRDSSRPASASKPRDFNRNLTSGGFTRTPSVLMISQVTRSVQPTCPSLDLEGTKHARFCAAG